MRTSQVLTIVLAAGAVVSVASAQIDPAAPWGAYRGNQLRTASVTASGFAEEYAMTVAGHYPVCEGGFSVGANGDLYFKTHRNSANVANGGPGCTVVRMDRDTGAVLASVELGGGSGNYAGLTHAVNGLWTAVYGGTSATEIVRLNATTLAIEQEITNAAFGGLRGAPLIGSVPNMNGHLNLYVHDRNNNQIHCVDSVTGDLMWSYTPIGGPASFGKMGPSWTSGGRDVFAYFANTSVLPGVAIKDNGDSTYTELWVGGPENFNWIGSGATATPGGTIYVNTFTDDNGAGPTPTLWAIDPTDGSVIWAVDGHRGEGEDIELNFFSRPTVVGNRVYCCGGYGVVTCFVDNGASYTQAWEYRDLVGEFTICTAAVVDGQTYVYAARQGAWDTTPPSGGEFLVLRDDGNAYTQMLLTDIGGAMWGSLYGNNSAMPDPDGNVWVAGGTWANAGTDAGEIYKFSAVSDCYADCDGNGTLNALDFLCFLNLYGAGDMAADCNGDSTLNALDFLCYLNLYSAGC